LRRVTLGRVMTAQPTLLIVIDRRELVLGCLSSWLRTFRREFEVMSVVDAENSLTASEIARAGAVIVGSSVPMLSDAWLERQVRWLRDSRADMPIVAIAEPVSAVTAEAMVLRLRLQGYIPTSSTMKVAAAALRLVLAGGAYLPCQPEGDRPPPEVSLEPMTPADEIKHCSTLTSRERAVLGLLQRGMANKSIAYHLNMSKSTVKVHVHNIMAKLNVHNRTEAAVAVRNVSPAAPSSNHEPADQGASARLALSDDASTPSILGGAKQSLPRQLR
jgi:DNA-binding NarL/FixJ family response regulator